MTATHEVRFDIPASDLAVLDGYCNATGKSRADFIRSLVIDWASGKLHEAIVICRVAGVDPHGADAARIRGGK